MSWELNLFYWTGWTLLTLLMVIAIGTITYWLPNKIMYQWITFKAIVYALCSEAFMWKKNERLAKKIDMRIGRKWWVKYRGKNYLWEIVKIEDADKTEKVHE